MSEIIDQLYTPLLAEHGFIRDPDNRQYGALGVCWKLSPEVGEGTYWTYGQKHSDKPGTSLLLAISFPLSGRLGTFTL